MFAIDFDFVAHALMVSTSDGDERSFALEPMSVADFYRKTMSALGDLAIEVAIFTRPVEVQSPPLYSSVWGVTSRAEVSTASCARTSRPRSPSLRNEQREWLDTSLATVMGPMDTRQLGTLDTFFDRVPAR